MSQVKYHPAIDALRLLSILAVILIHTTTRSLEITHYDLIHSLGTLFLNQISRFAVPLFFMISGFVLELNFSEQTNLLTYFKKRLSRLVLPYVFWSAVYYFFIYTSHNTHFGWALLTGSASYQLYFIPSLLILYAIFPLLHKLYGFIVNKWVLAAMGIIQVIVLHMDYRDHTINLFYPLAIVLFNYFVFVIGMIAARHETKIKEVVAKWKLVFFGLAAASGYWVFREGFTTYYQTYNFQAFYSQWRPSVLLYTIFLAACLYYLFSKISLGQALIKKLSSLSFAVFFVHVIVLETVWRLWTPGNDLVFFGIVAFTSFALSLLAHKVPKLAHLTG